MPRDHARINLTIWNDPDFRRLPPAAQHLYLALWTSPALSRCGVHDWRPGRLVSLSHGLTTDHIETVAACLQARHFIVVDRISEEVLVRSWARFDGLMKQPKMAVSFVYAYSAVASEALRGVLVTELHKIKSENPDLACWKDKRVAEVVSHPGVPARSLPVPTDPFGVSVDHGPTPGLALGLPQTQGGVSTGVSTPPTPSPSPSPTTSGRPGAESDGSAAPPPTPTENKTKATAQKRRLPDDFTPNEKHEQLAAELDIDLASEWPKFVDHWRSNGETKADWDATLRNWIRRGDKFGARKTDGDWLQR